PRFHLAADWSDRLFVGVGTDVVDDRFFPRSSWRPATPDELSLLVRDVDESTPAEELDTSLCLFRLPDHLRSELWSQLEQGAESLGHANLPGFDSFVNGVGDFLAFKGLPFPEDARCGLIVSDPGQQTVRRDPDTRLPAGLTCNFAPSVPWPFEDEERWP